ncbi:MAG: excinuclease ABC subunit A, partial [Sutterellaceae bacterium]|nr:excinuclease ABC subunit A [Sutterellaceae bacterium]
VSGSGKSTLVSDVLVPAFKRKMGGTVAAGAHDFVRGAEYFDDVVFVDQSAIGANARSNPVLYIGAFDAIRQLFAGTRLSLERGYTPATFSFNTGSGRCPACQGAGFEVVEMQFLSDIHIECETCHGKRYRPETLEVKINLNNLGEKSIADILDMTVDEALAYFATQKDIANRLSTLSEVGLGYMKLGQSLATLSGGEAQRLKLAEILAQSRSRKNPNVLYVFDEPTTGLHFDDVAKLIKAFRRLIEAGQTVLTVEHNLDVIAAGDWIVDLGPEGGDEGGTIVVEGTPEKVMQHPASYTAKALCAYREMIGPNGKSMEGIFTDAKPLSTTAASPGRSLQSIWRSARAGDMGIFGAREHNLKNIDAVIPKKELTVVTGVSGSGKSTLAFGIVFSEGQRRYLDSLNAYARSIAQPPARPDVEQVTGIAPTVAIEQRTSRGGQKSTVATLTEIQHFLRLVYVKLGIQYCPTCRIPVTTQSLDAIIADIMQSMRGQTVTVTAPVVVARKGTYEELAERYRTTLGVASLRVDGRWKATEGFGGLSRYSDHTIEVPFGTFEVSPENEALIRQAVKAAVEQTGGTLNVVEGTSEVLPRQNKDVTVKRYSTKRACPQCGESFPEPDPRLFSYNSRIGWCPHCLGSGLKPETHIAQNKPLSAEEEQLVTYTDDPCPDCHGMRLNRVARNVFFEGRSICDTTALSVDDCLKAIRAIRLTGRSLQIGADALKEIVSRLEFLQKVGLGYMSLDRAAPSLSGGEAQRIRLASQLGSTLQGVCYVLDEPTIGLHARDNALLIDTLTALKNKGNTVIVVEHDEEMIRRADHIVDIGPGAGSRGGELMAIGSLEDLRACKNSITAQMLNHPLVHDGHAKRPIKAAP